MAINSTVEQIKERLNIVDVVGEYIKIEKAGKNYKALSPFSNEKSPSFFISTDQNLYHCFSTGKGGDIFTFVQEMEGVDFKESLQILAEKAGVEISYESKGDQSKKKRLEKILDVSAVYYTKHLENHQQAETYLKDRGLKEETIKNWRLGYSPSSWRMLLDFFTKKKVTVKELEEVGLVKSGDKGTTYDRFRDRVMFPIFDSNSKVVAYSGRILSKDSEEAKYINSPETIFFNKSSVLYGYNFAKQAIRKLNFSILVEGQMDVVMAHQAGYSNTVASSGTALTEIQLKLLRRLSDRLVIALDGDSAGLRASEKAWQMALSLGIDVKIAILPKGSDPADLIKDNISEWKNAIRESKHIIDVLADNIIEEEDNRRKAQRISKEIIPYIISLPSKIEQSFFIKKIADRFNIKDDAMWDEIKGGKAEEKPTIKRESKKSNHLQQVIAILVWQESSKGPSINVEKIREKLIGILGQDKFEEIHKSIVEDRETLSTTEIFYGDSGIDDEIVEDMVKNIENQILILKRESLSTKLKKAEADGDASVIDETLKEIQEISKRIV
ncbi:MAG: DNA primase [Candidatus Paceibacteria bacterium]|jgi:DNA primase